MRSLYSVFACAAVLLGNLSAAELGPIRPGDRVAIVGNTFADQLRIHGFLETLLLLETSGKPISVRNLGWAGDMLGARDRPTNFPTEESTLRAHQTDVIVACFGMGESFEGEKGLADFRTELDAFIASHRGKTYNGKTEARLILVSPIAYENLGELTPRWGERNRELEAYTRVMSEVAAEAKLPFVNLYDVSRRQMVTPSGPRLTGNGIHLNEYGYWAMSHAFMDQLMGEGAQRGESPWLLNINIAAESAKGKGAKISELFIDAEGISFLVTEKSAPRLAPPTDKPLPDELEAARDRLVVENLKPGAYELTVEGQKVVTASAEAWARGVAVDASPAHRTVEKYHSQVNDKNLQFTYSWKALNQVHIVGERRMSPSGRALPEEVVAFNELAKDRDRTLAEGIELKTRQWRLERVSE